MGHFKVNLKRKWRDKKNISDLSRNSQCEPASSWLPWTRLINFSVHLFIHLFREVNPRLWLLVSTQSLNQSPRITQQLNKTSGRQKDKKGEPLCELNPHYSSQAQYEEGSECSRLREWSRQKQSSGRISWVVQPWGGFSPSQKHWKLTSWQILCLIPLQSQPSHYSDFDPLSYRSRIQMDLLEQTYCSMRCTVLCPLWERGFHSVAEMVEENSCYWREGIRPDSGQVDTSTSVETPV